MDTKPIVWANKRPDAPPGKIYVPTSKRRGKNGKINTRWVLRNKR